MVVCRKSSLHLAGSRICRAVAVALACALAGLWAPPRASAGLRPLVRQMLEQLESLQEIGEGVALGDYAKIERAAQALRAGAKELESLDLSTVGLDPARDKAFDAYAAAQDEAARLIEEAAKKKDARETIARLRRLKDKACLSCHRDFREKARLLKTSVLFMTNILSAWKDMNRGLAVNDLQFVAQRAREVVALSRVLSWNEVIQKTFNVKESGRQKTFRNYVGQLNLQASRIERAALSGHTADVMDAMQRMWDRGCIPCHDDFRRAPKKP